MCPDSSYRIAYPASIFLTHLGPSVSFCASLLYVCAFSTVLRTLRIITIAVFTALYLSFIILFGQALVTWDENVAGRCYNTMSIASPDAAHPHVDLVYLGVTCSYLSLTLLFCLLPEISTLVRPQHLRRKRLRFRTRVCLRALILDVLGPSVVSSLFRDYSVFAALLQFPVASVHGRHHEISKRGSAGRRIREHLGVRADHCSHQFISDSSVRYWRTRR